MVSTSPEGLQNADGLTDHGPRNLELAFEVLGEHNVAGRELAGNDPGPQMLDGAMVKAGRHSRKHSVSDTNGPGRSRPRGRNHRL